MVLLLLPRCPQINQGIVAIDNNGIIMSLLLNLGQNTVLQNLLKSNSNWKGIVSYTLLLTLLPS